MDRFSLLHLLTYMFVCVPSSQPVYIQFSKHKELVVSNPSQALTAAASDSTDSQANTILHVTVEHLIYPVTVDILHQVSEYFLVVFWI